MNKKIRIILVAISVVICSALFIYFEKNKIKNTLKNSSVEEQFTPENIEDIPPSIIDNVAPDVEQKFKAEAKDFEVHDKDGNEMRLSNYKGNYIILNFWNSSCDLCKEQLLYFEKVINKYEGQIKFLMINIIGENETTESVLNYLKENNINIDTVFDDHYDVRINYKISTLPRTIFIDKSGLIQKDLKVVLNEDILEKHIQELINNEN